MLVFLVRNPQGEWELVADHALEAAQLRAEVERLRAGKLDEMVAAYDKVLARAPLFDQRASMVPGYLALAASLDDAARPRKLAVLRKALRLDENGPKAQAIAAEIAFLDAEDIASHGVVDVGAYEKALALDPTHVGARAALARLTSERDAREGTMRRYAAAVAIGVAALLGALAVVLRRRDA